MSNLPKNEEEFNKLMEEIDNTLKGQGVPIKARQLMAAGEASKKLGVNIYIVGEEHAIPGDYSGLSLSAHIKIWFNERYGEKLKVNFSPGQAVVLIKNDPYRMKLPRIFAGKVKFICEKNLTHFPNEAINVLNLIEGLTKKLAETLTDDELWAILKFFIKFNDAIYGLEAKSIPFKDEAKADLQMSVDNIFSSTHGFGQSKWASLQFTEKILKGYLMSLSRSFPKKHDLTILNNLLKDSGLTNVSKDLLDLIQCSADVRYDSKLVSLDEAINAHHASIEVLYLIFKK